MSDNTCKVMTVFFKFWIEKFMKPFISFQALPVEIKDELSSSS